MDKEQQKNEALKEAYEAYLVIKDREKADPDYPAYKGYKAAKACLALLGQVDPVFEAFEAKLANE